MKKKATQATRYMSDETQLELMKQLFIQVTHDNKNRPVIRADFAEWLGLENAVFWVATTYTVWRYKSNPTADERAEFMGENMVILHEVFGTELKVLSEMILAELREIRDEELREIEEEQEGKLLN